MFMAWTFGSFEVKESAQDIFYYYRHGWRNVSTNLFYYGYFQVEGIVLQLFRGSTSCHPDVFLCSILRWFGVGEGQRWLKFPNVLPRHFRHDPTTLRLLRRTLGGLDDDGYSLRRIRTDWKSIKEFDICFGTTRENASPLPVCDTLLSRSSGARIEFESHVCALQWHLMCFAMIYDAHCNNI